MMTELEESFAAGHSEEVNREFEEGQYERAAAAAANDGYNSIGEWLAAEGVTYACTYYGLDYDWCMEACPAWYDEDEDDDPCMEDVFRDQEADEADAAGW